MNLTYEQLVEALSYRKYNKIEFVDLYDYQKKFINATGNYLQAMFSGGNRLGKTIVGSYLVSCVATGNYPEWWTGFRAQGSGHDIIVAGWNQRSTINTLQKKLLGTASMKLEDEIGTGFIPRHLLDLDTMEKDGARCVSVNVKHTDGGYNTLHFFTQEDEGKIMGMNVILGWMDEEKEGYAGEFYSQLLTRTLTTNGLCFITATPENGTTPLVKKFLDSKDDPNSLLYMQVATVYDAPHITEAMIEKIKAGVPEFQWKTRLLGQPAAGQGAVFRVKEEDITYETEDFDYTDPSLVVNYGIDFGVTTDPSVIMVCLYNRNTDCFYIDEEFYLGEAGDVESRSPENMARVILSSRFPNAQIITPHDGGINSIHPQSKAKLMEQYGVTRLVQHKNPNELLMSSGNAKVGSLTSGRQSNNQSTIAIIPMLDKLSQLFREDRLAINKRCIHLLREIRSYYYEQKESGGVKPRGEDHCIDAMRLGVAGLLRNVYDPLDIASNPSSYNWSGPTDLITFGDDIPSSEIDNYDDDYNSFNHQW